MPFKVTFESEVGAFDARMSRSQAVDWLKSTGIGGMVSGTLTGPTTPVDRLDDDDLARAIAVATNRLVSDMADRHASLNIRNEPDDEPRSWVTVTAGSILAIKVMPYSDTGGEEEAEEEVIEGPSETGPAAEEPEQPEFPFLESDKEWLEDLLKDFGEDPDERRE